MITTRGGTIAVICSRFQSQYNYEFAMDTMQPSELGWGTHEMTLPPGGSDCTGEHASIGQI